MTAIMQRAKEPGDVAKKLYTKRAKRLQPQSPAEARAVVSMLAGRYGWKARTVTKKPPTGSATHA